MPVGFRCPSSVCHTPLILHPKITSKFVVFPQKLFVFPFAWQLIGCLAFANFSLSLFHSLFLSLSVICRKLIICNEFSFFLLGVCVNFSWWFPSLCVIFLAISMIWNLIKIITKQCDLVFSRQSCNMIKFRCHFKRKKKQNSQIVRCQRSIMAVNYGLITNHNYHNKIPINWWRWWWCWWCWCD